VQVLVDLRPLMCLVDMRYVLVCFFFFQAEDGIRDRNVTGVQTCALPIFILGGGYLLIVNSALAAVTIVGIVAGVLFAFGIWVNVRVGRRVRNRPVVGARRRLRSEEHTSELQSRFDLVCRLLLEKKNKNFV